MDHWVMDYETLPNLFLGVFEHYKTNEVKVFAICKFKNDLPKFLAFLKQNINCKQWHISFNGLAFDSQITEFIIRNHTTLMKLDAEEIANLIYKKAQECISRQDTANMFQEWSEKQLSIKQIDLYKLNHWDNPAKRSSLKSIQIAMDWHNVQDMPIHHTTRIQSIAEIQEVAKYCRNDVSSTKAIMEKSAKQIQLRGTLTKEYGTRLYSASEPRISKVLFAYFLSKKTGIEPQTLTQMRTFRKEIRFKDIILPYIEFNDLRVFQDLLQKFKSVVLDPSNTRGGFKYSVEYRGVKTDFGLGGVHGAKKGIYEATEEMTIMSSDVTSFYPNLAIRNGWAPAHLPKKAFCDLYEWFFEERKKIPKSDPRNYVYKIILNSTYGLSNDKHSFLYDPEFTMKITVNGQLSLMMLYTMLAEGVPGAVPIMQNTDGLEMIIPRSQKENYLKICSMWENITNLQLEHDEYQKLVVPDVNNYIGVFDYKEVSMDKYLEVKESAPEYLFKKENGKYYYAPTKCKGRFEFKDLALHKNKSFQIVPKAIYHYFVHGIKPEDFLKENRNIFDYIGAVKIKGAWKFQKIYTEMGEYIEEDLQKTLRYYVSTSGCKIIKQNLIDTKREIQVVSGKWLQTIFNVYQEKSWEEYKVDDRFYLEKIYKEIESMEPEKFDSQLSLF